MHLHSPTAHSDPGTAAPAPWPRLVADIGGTNVRFALIAHPGAAPSALRSLRCADFAGPGEALRAFDLLELRPLQRRFDAVNEWLGQEVIAFDPLEALPVSSSEPASPAMAPPRIIVAQIVRRLSNPP